MLALFTLGGVVVSRAQPLSVPERVASLKASLVTSQMNLKRYEWIETTVVSLKGEEKSRKQERCYYGEDGALQKVVIDASSPAEKRRGSRGMIAENKKEELAEYTQSAVSLLKSYVPPDPARIQAAKDAGKVAIDVLEPDKRLRINFHDYQKIGDNLGVAIDTANNRPLGMTVSTYLDNAQDVVALDSRLGQLDDGTIYPAEITLQAQAKGLQVTVQNNGYRVADDGHPLVRLEREYDFTE
jgi:hypothetical protein